MRQGSGYVMDVGRTRWGINKRVDAGATHEQFESTDALRWVLRTTLASHLQFRGWFAKRLHATEVQ